METQTEVVEKLKRILDSFLNEDYVASSNVYFEKLITHLRDPKYASILQMPFALEWVDRCIQLIHEDFKKVNPRVISFMLNFCSLLALNEWTIVEIRDRCMMDRILFIADRDMHQFNPSMKLGSIRLLSSLSRYSLGLAYVRSVKAWRFLINYCNKDHTLYVVREAQQLLYEFLYKFSVKMNDEQIVMEILGLILQPIQENVFIDNNENVMVYVDDTELQQTLAANLNLLSYIFQQTLVSEEKCNIVHLCLTHFELYKNLWKLNQMTQTPAFLEKILTAITSINFARLVYEKWESGQIAAENFNKFGVSFYNIMKFCIHRHQCVIFLKLTELNHVLWKKLGARAPSEILIENERVRFENQLIVFQLLPLLLILRTKEFQEEEVFDKYTVKLLSISCEHTLRISYVYRDVIESSDSTNGQLIADLAAKSIHGIISMENILERDQAILVFQSMMFALKKCILQTEQQAETVDEPNTKSTELIVEIPNVLYAALIGLKTLIQRYHITWKESLETICLVNFVTTILENPNLSTRLAVQALKLLQLAVEHFLSPNMVLLVDSLQGSSLVCIGPIILKRVHDNAWEVRDSTLEFLTSIANISHLKFPAFQQFMFDHKMGSIVFQMAQNDSEPYVRASAFKCLAQMVAINLIWENELSNVNLIDHLFSVLYNESEGIVRKEAVTVLVEIYNYRRIANQYRDKFYSTLAYSAVADLHWEVKVHALRFWKMEIQKQFTNQGMIDGTFPAVTFSIEQKKIVKLTAKEINLRIVKIFTELSQCGCLGVILKCLHDDCDLEVVKEAQNIVHCLFEKLKVYDYEAILGGMNDDCDANCSQAASNTDPQDLEQPNEPLSLPTAEEEKHADDVIESILSTQDINYLITACERQLELNGGQAAIASIDEQFYTKYANVSAKEFLTTLKNVNLEQLIQNHYAYFSCVESFASLLDDISFTLPPENQTNSIDCY